MSAGAHQSTGPTGPTGPATRSTPGPPISACIISFQEADRIADCLRSLAFCDELLVVDSHSTDATREIAAEHGARVIERDWPGHVAQKEFAIRQAQHDWVLCVDCDERISDPLRGEIEALRAAGFGAAGNAPPAGWNMPRMSNYLGRWIRHGTWYPDRQLRLFDRRRGHWGGHDPHDRVELDGPMASLRGDLLHLPYRNLDDHLATIDRYTHTMAEGLHDRGRRARVWHLVLNPLIRFLRIYVLKAGFLEGWRGFVIACLAAHYVRLKYTRLMILQRCPSDPHP